MSSIVPKDDSPLRPVHDHIVAEVPEVLANAGIRGTIELVEVEDTQNWTVFWRITVLQEEDGVDIHSRISDIKDGIESSIKYLYNARARLSSAVRALVRDDSTW